MRTFNEKYCSFILFPIYSVYKINDWTAFTSYHVIVTTLWSSTIINSTIDLPSPCLKSNRHLRRLNYSFPASQGGTPRAFSRNPRDAAVAAWRNAISRSWWIAWARVLARGDKEKPQARRSDRLRIKLIGIYASGRWRWMPDEEKRSNAGQ